MAPLGVACGDFSEALTDPVCCMFTLWDKGRRSGGRMAHISFDDEVAYDVRRPTQVRASEHKWSARRTLAFVVLSSLALWALILSPFFLF